MTPPSTSLRLDLPNPAWWWAMGLVFPVAAAFSYLLGQKIRLTDLILGVALTYMNAVCGVFLLRSAVGRGLGACLLWGLAVNGVRLVFFTGLALSLEPVLGPAFPSFITAWCGGLFCLLAGEVAGLHRGTRGWYKRSA